MPLYEFYCEHCDLVFEALKPLSRSEEPTPCTTCSNDADRIMPTTFASMSFKEGYAQRVPYHHRPLRSEEAKRTVALVNPKRPRAEKRIDKGKR